jgi:multiple sugar transport system substrate-binding protein
MRKLVLLLVMCSILVSIFTSCISKQEDASNQQPDESKVGQFKLDQGKPTELKVWMPPFGTEDSLDKDFWEQQFVQFENDNNVKTSIEITPWAGYEEKYLTGISSGAGPDVGYMYAEMVADFINMGALEPFDAYLTEEEKANYIYLENGKFQGKQYMLPIVVGNPRILLCNMEILGKSGIDKAPQTWDEFVEAGKKVLADSPDIYPFLQPWGDTNAGGLNALFFPFVWQAGSQLFNEQETKLMLDSPQAISAAQFIYDLRFKHKIMPDTVTSLKNADVENAFLEGKVAMIIGTTSYTASRVEPSGMKWDYSVLKGQKQATFVAMDSLIITSKSNNKELAAKAAKYMTSGSAMTNFHKNLSKFPPIGRDEEYADIERFKTLYEDKNIEFNNYPTVAGMFKVVDMLYKNLQLMMLDQMKPEEVMQDVAKYADTIIGQ